MENSKIVGVFALLVSQFFENYPNENEVFVTEDGQAFIMENRAALHASQNKISYKKFVRNFDEKPVEGTTKVALDDVPTPKQADALTEKQPETRGAEQKDIDTAKQNAEDQAKKIEEDPTYEPVAAIVAKIPTLSKEELQDYLDIEKAKETPRVTLVKALSEAIAKLETPENN